EVLGDRPGQGLNRKARLNSARDGWVIIDFDCPSCGWTASLTCLIDDQGVKPPSITLARAEEVEQYTKPEPAPRPQRIALPEPKPVPLDELYDFAVKNLPLELDYEGKTLVRKLEKTVMPAGDDPSGASYVKVTYSDGRLADGR